MLVTVWRHFWYLLNYLYVIYFQVGLAVDDIKGIQEAASLKKLALQVRLNDQVC